jgi:hypothetical protein
MVTLLVLMACDPEGNSDTGGGTPDTAVGHDSAPEVIGGDTSADTADTGDPGDDTGTSEAEEEAYESFYDPDAIQQIVISITGEDRAAMDTEAASEREEHPDNPGYSYFPADLTINGEQVVGVGVRYKGKSSFQYWSEKPSLKVKFNAFDSGLRFAGLKRVGFDSMVGDDAMCRSVVGYHIWREAGIAAPKANFAQLYLSVDGGAQQYLGLYANVEDMDDAWVKHNFEEDKGDLWEGLDSADFTNAGITHFALAAGDGDAAALDHVRKALQGHGDDFYDDADEVVDMENFLEFWTLAIATGNRAGYPFHLEKFFVYLDPADDRLRFSPADMDESFDTATPVYAGYVTGSIGAFCLYYDDACEAQFRAALTDAVAFYEGTDVASFADEMQALTAVAMQDDSRKNLGGVVVTTSQVSQARDRLNYRIEMYPEWLREKQGL